MKTIFVSEYLCGGAWLEDILPDSLLTEGRAMLEALCEDLLTSGDYRVCTTRDKRVSLATIPGLEVIDVESPIHEWETFQNLARKCDATLVIAPELDEILCDRIEWLEQNGLNHFMSTSNAVRTCADKMLFYEFCQQQEIPTPETHLLQEIPGKKSEFHFRFPFIIKPQFGAGTTMTAVIRNAEDLETFSNRRKCEADFPPYITQPYLPGKPVSITCIISPDGRCLEWCPVTVQLFDELEYQGGVIPCDNKLVQQVQTVAEQVVENLPGLRGYIGFDFLLDGIENPVQILEVNTRLTTSYLGYREIAKSPLADRLVNADLNSQLRWSSKSIQFDAQGNVS